MRRAKLEGRHIGRKPLVRSRRRPSGSAARVRASVNWRKAILSPALPSTACFASRRITLSPRAPKITLAKPRRIKTRIHPIPAVPLGVGS